MKAQSHPSAAPLQHLISTGGLGCDWLERCFKLAGEVQEHPDDYSAALRGKVIATLFFQPSTRTRLGFQRAALALGAQTIGCESIVSTRASAETAESLADSARVLSELCDLLVLRHYISGAALTASVAATVPVINAGDGSNEHPTQSIADAWIMQRRLGGLRGATIGIVGDPGARVLRSLLTVMVHLSVGKVLFLIPPMLPISNLAVSAVNISLPPDIRYLLMSRGTAFDFRSDVRELLSECDAIEMLPVRVPTLEALPEQPIRPDYKTPERFVVTRAKLVETSTRCILLHPGPRHDELDPDTDAVPNSLYFEQVREGHFARMAILQMVGGSR